MLLFQVFWVADGLVIHNLHSFELMGTKKFPRPVAHAPPLIEQPPYLPVRRTCLRRERDRQAQTGDEHFALSSEY